VGIVISSFSKIGSAVTQMLDGDNLPKYRANAVRIRNRAVYEIPEILSSILEQSGR